MKLPALSAILAFCIVGSVTIAYALPQNKKSVARSDPSSLLGKRYVARLGRDVPTLAKTSDSDVPMFQAGSSSTDTLLDRGGKSQKASTKNAGRPVRQNRKTRFNKSLKRRKVGEQHRVVREGPVEEQNLLSNQGSSPPLVAASSSSSPNASATSAVVQPSSTPSPSVPTSTTGTPSPVPTSDQKAMKKIKGKKPGTPNAKKVPKVRGRRQA